MKVEQCEKKDILEFLLEATENFHFKPSFFKEDNNKFKEKDDWLSLSVIIFSLGKFKFR